MCVNGNSSIKVKLNGLLHASCCAQKMADIRKAKNARQFQFFSSSSSSFMYRNECTFVCGWVGGCMTMYRLCMWKRKSVCLSVQVCVCVYGYLNVCLLSICWFPLDRTHILCDCAVPNETCAFIDICFIYIYALFYFSNLSELVRNAIITSFIVGWINQI